MTFSKQFPQTITTNLSTIPSIPQFKVENPLKKTIFCNGIEVVCTPEFTRKGAMVVRVNNVDLYDSRKTKGFERLGKLAISLDAELERDRKVEIFIINEVDSNLIECNVNIFLDEFSKTLDSSLSYISDDVVNTNVSKTETLFPFRTYTSTEQTPVQLINMEGYKKLIILLSESTGYVPPTLLLGGANAVDGNLDTFFTISRVINFPDGEVDTCIVDFGVVAQRLPIAKVARIGGNASSWTWRFYYMGATGNPLNPNDPNWVLADTTVFGTGTRNLETTGLVTSRYMRTTIQADASAGDNRESQIFELFDGVLFGGQASLSFEVKDIQGNFQTLIPDTEFGIISTGEAVVAQVGDTNNVSLSGKVYFLPSTQTDFRARLTITEGVIETGISMVKIT